MMASLPKGKQQKCKMLVLYMNVKCIGCQRDFQVSFLLYEPQFPHVLSVEVGSK